MKTHILAAALVAAVMAGVNPARAGEPAEAFGTRTDAAPKQELRLERLTPEYWRVTLDNPPFNIFGPETIPQLNSIITQIETDPKVRVVVFQSAVPGFFLTHYDFVPPLSATTDIPPGVTGLATRFGRMAAQMTAYLDQAGGLWARGALNGKVGSAFSSTASQHGGQEMNLFSTITNLLHFGMVVVGLPYSFGGLTELREITGGTPYGATTIAGLDGSRQPSENELSGARYHGRHVAEIANKIFG